MNKFGPNWVKPHKLNATERAEVRKSVEPIWNQYKNLPLTLDIDDEPVRRLCQVLTNEGYGTFSSCQGHGREKPHIYFGCRKSSAVAELSHILRQTAITNFIWMIEVNPLWDGKRFRSMYEIKPERPRRQKNLDIIKDQNYLIEDFDILGYSIFDYFHNEED